MCDFLDFEENSKKLREFQREKRIELQLIISRCNEIGFNYICVPKEKARLCFGSTQPRKTPILALKASELNSYMRKVTNEFFPEPTFLAVPQKTTIEEEEAASKINLKPSSVFASKVQRFQDAPIMVSGRRRRRKLEKKISTADDLKICFGSMKHREFTLTTQKNIKPENIPGVGTYDVRVKPPKILNSHSFGGPVEVYYTVKIECSTINKELCSVCEKRPKNIYLKNNEKPKRTVCKDCLFKEIKEVKTKAKTYLDRMKKLAPYKCYEKYRYCGNFLHQHQKNSTAKIRLLTPIEVKNRLRLENYLSKYFDENY